MKRKRRKKGRERKTKEGNREQRKRGACHPGPPSTAEHRRKAGVLNSMAAGPAGRAVRAA
ncbi:hypothetical protein C2U47_02265 [Aeromonas sp. ASNIH7]|nr:hypothetical protein MC60_006330 [Aeromonas caviae]AUV15587.1 hypothetical protein C2U47_02265 [Aeromonas sp. ASNIH7]